MNSHRVNILHVADRNNVPKLIPHNLIFYFFEMVKILLNEHLRAYGEGPTYDLFQLSFIFRNAGFLPAQRKSCANHKRITNFFGNFFRLLPVSGGSRRRDRNSSTPQMPREKSPVFGKLDRFNRRAEYFYTIF